MERKLQIQLRKSTQPHLMWSAYGVSIAKRCHDRAVWALGGFKEA